MPIRPLKTCAFRLALLGAICFAQIEPVLAEAGKDGRQQPRVGLPIPPAPEEILRQPGVSDQIQTPVAVSLFDLARFLEEPVERIMLYNGVKSDHVFPPGSWLIIPADKKGMAVFRFVQYYAESMQGLVGAESQLASQGESMSTGTAVSPSPQTSRLERLELLGNTPSPSTQQSVEAPVAPQAPSPVPAKGVVRLGDTLFKIAQRYGTSMQEILRLNPGLDTARLVAGTEIQLARRVQPVAPNPLRFDQSLDELVRQGVLSPAERQRIPTGATTTPQQSLAHQQACSSGVLSEQECTSGVVVRLRGISDNRSPKMQAVSPPLRPARLPPPSQDRNAITPQVKPLSERETALLQEIRKKSEPVLRQYGKCKYNWSYWRKIQDDIRTTFVDCGETREWTIGVSCKRLMVNIYTQQFGWQGWVKPAGPSHETRSGEDEMVAALCANLSR